MALFELSLKAEEDLTKIWLYYADVASDKIADRMIDEIAGKCQILAQNPEIGKMRNELIPGLRSFPVNPHIIFYDIVARQHIVVRRILHQSRDIDTALNA